MGGQRRAWRLVKAVDTNVLACALIRDDPGQTAAADRILSEGAFVPATVLLEVAWLLKARYGMSRAQVVAALRAVLDMPAVVVDAAEQIEWAIGRLADGGDAADLIHIASLRGAAAFVTFDRGIAAAAGADSPLPIETLA